VQSSDRILIFISQAMPHKLVEDDFYNGYLIPGGSTVLGNVWAILHNPDVFPDPERFLPEHFLPEELGGTLPDGASDFPDAAFGFGRRACPGQHMAYSSVWLTVASMLAVFDIDKAKDKDGEVIEVAEDYSDGMVSCVATTKFMRPMLTCLTDTRHISGVWSSLGRTQRETLSLRLGFQNSDHTPLFLFSSGVNRFWAPRRLHFDYYSLQR